MDIGLIAKKYLKEQKLSSIDVELILASVLKKSREFILSHPEFVLSQVQFKKIETLIKKRQKGVPLAYLIGKNEFFGLEFKVDKNVLIPRPETELLVEEALKLLKTKNYQLKTKIIDIGTGSGNIIISIAKNLANQPSLIGHPQLLGIDISARALFVAKRNAKFHKVDKKIKFLAGNMLDPIIRNSKFEIRNSRIIILANLPYVSEINYKKYRAGIKFEPRNALISKRYGLQHYEKLFTQIKKMMNDDQLLITIIFEFSPEQKNKVNKLIKNYFPLSKIILKKDLAGKYRMAKFDL